MDVVVYGALEEICSQGVNGITIRDLWPKIHSHLSANELHLCTNVKKAIWSNLINIPSLRFESQGILYDAEDPKIQTVEGSEAIDLKIVATEPLLNSFIGIYDITASDAGISHQQRRVLERLAIARTDGVTQNEIAKEFGIKGNKIYYILKNLESRGLIVRQSTIIRKTEAGDGGQQKNSSIVHTNMLYLYRYAKHLGRLQRLEITKEDKSFKDDENEGRDVAVGEGVSEEHTKEDVHIKDYVPAMRAICDRLEKADGKVLVVSDLKRELDYRKTSGHRAWRNILHRLKDARLVEEFCATVNNKEVSCLRLLKKFSSNTDPKTHGDGDDIDTEQQVKLGKRGQITEQLVELPIEQQIYDIIEAEGSKGLMLNEIYKRLGINNKSYYPRILDMVSRFQMHLDSEGLNRGVAYRVWTSGNLKTGVSNTLQGKSEDTIDEKYSTHAHVGQLESAHATQESDHSTFNVDAKVTEEKDISPIESGFSHASPAVDCEPSGSVPDAELQLVNVQPASNIVSLEMSPSASPSPARIRSYPTYPRLSLSSAISQREQRILEALQEEKILIKPELQRLLESLENHEKEKHTTMDRRTLERSVNKLQGEGRCKCISFAVPNVTNCGRNRTVDVILHPSVYNAEDLSDRVHERLRSFERTIRTQGFSQQKKGKSVPVLNNVERIDTHVKKDVSAATCEAMRNNGFVLAKMVRAKLLHIFLWGYLTSLPAWDDGISSGKHGDERPNPHSTCKLFELDASIKAMPVELFLQVAGSSVKFEDMVEKCRNGLCLSDLPTQEYRCLMDTRATARLSYLIDILRRLKLIRLIGGELLDPTEGPHATLRHSLELKPYIEEPIAMVFPSTGVNSDDLRPHVRHDFVLASRKGVDEYWKTLEYCYAASDPKAALHSFPGSAVHEVFRSRSWASVRVMTADQRVELFKLVANEDPNKKISYRECEKIAKDLNLTLEQVLRVFYDNRQKNKLKGAASAKEEFHPLMHPSLSHKRKKSLKGKSANYEKTLMEYSLDEESGKLKHAKISEAEDATKENDSSIRSSEDHETHIPIEEIGDQEEAVEDQELNVEGGHSYSSIHECALSKLKSAPRKRFAWTEDKDRQLVIEYVRSRAAVGAKFHRIDWASLQHLPGPPFSCQRRMALLNRNNQFRKAVMRLCNMLSVRYAKHLENSMNNCKVIVQDPVYNKHTDRNVSDNIDDRHNLKFEERWDDFDNEDVKMVLDEVLRYKQTAKLEATKVAGYISKYHRSNVGTEGNELNETMSNSQATPSKELTKGSGRRQLSTRKRRLLPKNYDRLMNGGKGIGTQTYKSVAVSNAVELFKLVFLNTAKAPEVPNLLAETLRRYSEHDLFAAFNYLRERNFMVGGNGINHFALSQQFLHSISSSPFPVNTAKRAVKMARWLHGIENDLLDEGVDLSADLQCGDLFHLCVLMCSGEVSVSPCLPDEGVGEIEDLKKRKCDDNDMHSADKAKKPKLLDSEIFSRKEKGFPGIQLFVSRNMISSADAITFSRNENPDSQLFLSSERGTSSASEHMKETFDCGDSYSKTNAASESTWESMTCYASHMTSFMQEQYPVHPDLFRTVYSAIQKAGDQGLSMEQISQITDVQGVRMPELIVEVLEAFGRALKVNAFDSVHVVDSLYRPKYLLTMTTSHQEDLDREVPNSCAKDGEPLRIQPENHKEKGTTLQKETCTNLDEVGTDPENIHRVTILNLPEEVPQPISGIQRNNEIETYKKAEVMSLRRNPEGQKCKFHIGDSPMGTPILPWINGDGTINEIVYKGLVRRILGIVMQNPGILEEHILSQNALNPQSCRNLLEVMILDNHITVRKMYQSTSGGPPAILSHLIGCNSSKKPKLIFREHFFANPTSISFL